MHKDTKNRLTIGDLLGGLAGAAVALPQSMGLGVGLFAAMGLGSAAGALAGLIGAASLSLVSGTGGYTRGMVSAPNGPVTMLLIASMTTLGARGISGGDALVALALLVMLAGFFQIVIALTGGGQLIKFIPYPMVAGLVTAIGILMTHSQLSPLVPAADNGMPGLWQWLPAATAVVTFVSIRLMPRLLRRMPAIIGGLLAGLATFHLAVALAPMSPPEAWMVGAIPQLHGMHLNIDWATLGTQPWDLLLPAAAALAVLASTDCLVTAVVADSATGFRHNARGELAAQGLGQVIAGLLGGLGGGGTKGSTLVAIGAGARRWSAMVAGVGFILILAAAGPIGRYLPVSLLAGVIIYVGFTMLEWRILLWLRRPRTRIDGILALLVIACTLYFDLIVGVGVGALGAILLFLRDQIRAETIHSRSTGRELRSLRLRSQEDKTLLDEHGDRIVYIELRGHLFFGTVDRLFTELATLLEHPVWVVVNMRRVQSIDLTALDLFCQMQLRLRDHGGHMLFANIHRRAAHAHKMDKLLRSFATGCSQPNIKTSFKSTDKALEAAEDMLLTELGRPPQPVDARVEIEDNDLFRGCDAGLLEKLQPLMQALQLPRKARPFNLGDPGDTIYFVIEGVVDLRLPSGTYHYKRLNSVGPGGYFGETTFVAPGPHSADAVITRDATLLTLSRAAIAHLDDQAIEGAAHALVLRLAQSIANHLRQARAEVRRLERW
jgi:SulP family sulfate permease